MPKEIKKQPAKKRVYVKKSDKLTRKQTITAIENHKAILKIDKPEQIKHTKDTEVESLALICSIFDNWDIEQKQRNLKYIVGRYYNFM